MAICRAFIAFLLAVSLAACGVAERSSYTADEPMSAPIQMSLHQKVIGESELYLELRSAFSRWEGTPYVLGGSSLSGVDCSAFTKTVFEDHFERELPRHTSEQLRAGDGVRRRFLQTGDLVFFRTARSTLHVGIYMGEGDFLHASVSEGVTISGLGDPYWATRYIGARRVL